MRKRAQRSGMPPAPQSAASYALLSSSSMQRGDEDDGVAVFELIIQTVLELPIRVVDQHENARTTGQQGRRAGQESEQREWRGREQTAGRQRHERRSSKQERSSRRHTTQRAERANSVSACASGGVETGCSHMRRTLSPSLPLLAVLLQCARKLTQNPPRQTAPVARCNAWS